MKESQDKKGFEAAVRNVRRVLAKTSSKLRISAEGQIIVGFKFKRNKLELIASKAANRKR